jgi:hypothetical protein
MTEVAPPPSPPPESSATEKEDESVSQFCETNSLTCIGDLFGDGPLPEVPCWKQWTKTGQLAPWSIDIDVLNVAATVSLRSNIVNIVIRAAAGVTAEDEPALPRGRGGGDDQTVARDAPEPDDPDPDDDPGGDDNDDDDAAADDEIDDGEFSDVACAPDPCRDVSEQLVLKPRRHCKHCGALYFTGGGVPGFTGTLNGHSCCGKGTLIAVPPAPPVHELPDNLREHVLSPLFPQLARWINSSVAFCNLYFKFASNNAHHVDGEHAVTVRGPMSARVANEATRGGLRLLLYSEVPRGRRNDDDDDDDDGGQPHAMAGGAQPVRRNRNAVAQRTLSAAHSAFVTAATNVVLGFLREHNVFARHFVSAFQASDGERASVAVELAAGVLPPGGRQEVSLAFATTRGTSLPAGRAPNGVVFRLPLPGEALVANDRAPQRAYVSMNSPLFDPLVFTCFFPTGQVGWYRHHCAALGDGALADAPDNDPADDAPDHAVVLPRSTTGRAMRLQQWVRSVVLHRSRVERAASPPLSPPPPPPPPPAESRSRRQRRPSIRAIEAAAGVPERPRRAAAAAAAAAVVEWERTVLQLGGRGLQEFVVTQFFRMEQQRLSYYARLQKRAREARQRVRLPAAHTQSPRWYADKRDATMATVVRRGKPTLFVTFTFNPTWPEVTRELAPGEDCADQPFLVNSVFSAKLKVLLTMLANGEAFGARAEYVTAVIEFQKRGYPHAHILLRLSGAKTTPDYIDERVTVLKPPAGTDDCALVESLMEHTCTVRSACRNAEGKCRRGFPKPAQPQTTIDAHGYPHYKRDSRSRNVVAYNLALLRYFGAHCNVEFCGSNAVVGYVLQYSFKGVDRMLVRETQERMRAGNGGAVDEIREYQSLRCVGALEAAWRLALLDIVSASVSVTSFGAHLPGQAPRFGDRDVAAAGDAPPPVVDTLSHVERYFARPTEQLFDVVTILEFTEQWTHIQAPRRTDVRDITCFEDVAAPPAKRWLWGKRSRPHAARMYTLMHTAGEQYYVRLLLLNVAARSFAELRTVDGTLHNTFAEAARARGLIDDIGGEYARVMREAVNIVSTPPTLRRLFVALVCNGAFAGDGTGAQVLLDAPLERPDNTVRHALRHDYYLERLALATGRDVQRATPELKATAAAAADDALVRELHRLFEARGFVDFVARFGVPPLPDAAPAAARADDVVVAAECARWRPLDPVAAAAAAAAADAALLTEEQRAVLDAVYARASNPPGGAADANLFVLCASAGCGKTFVARQLIGRLRALDKIVIVVASTGIAATMLPGGTTVHRRFGLPIEYRALGRAGGVGTVLDDVDITDQRLLHSTLLPTHPSRALLRRATLLLWDEAFSANRRLFQSVDSFLQAERRDARHMGGLTTLLIGDPRQIPPIIPGTLAELAIAQAALQSWPPYAAARKFVLTRSMRQERDPHFAAMLTDIGDGRAGIPVGQANDSTTHRRVLLRGIATHTSREHFLKAVFPDIHLPALCAARAIICARNDDVLEWNNIAITMLAGDETVLTAATQLADFADDGEQGRNVPLQYSVFTDEYLATVQPSGVPPHQLTLKPGAIAVLISNLAPDDGLTNGTKLIIDRIVSPVLLAVRARCPSTGAFTSHLIPRLRFKFNLHRTRTAVVRTQFPLLPAFAITCNRAQCQTLDFVGFDATVPVFSHGSLFVALSRARRAADVALFVGSDGRACDRDENGVEHAVAINVVFPSLIEDALQIARLQPAAQAAQLARH